MAGHVMTNGSPAPPTAGDVDVAAVAALYADPTRARVLVALADGRSLPAGVLATEAGVSPQAASSQLARLRTGGLVLEERSGRHRYYRLASARVAEVLELLAIAAPALPITSLRQGTRAAALRRARTCYDHLAGLLGCALTQALLDRQVLAATDDVPSTIRRASDRLSAPLADHPYRLGPAAEPVLAELGVDAPTLHGGPSRRPLLRFCLDWSEQRHHLAGRLGAALLIALDQAGWIARRPRDRAVTVTDRGRRELHARLGLEVPGPDHT